MTDVRLGGLLATQADVVAVWQLRAGGWSRKRIEHAVRRGGWRELHDGVFVRSRAVPTQRQRWFAAVLSAPGTLLSHASAAVCWGILERRLATEVVSRPGSGGPRYLGNLLVHRSKTLAPYIAWHQGLPLTSAARTLADLSPHLTDKQIGKAFRTALRLRATTIDEIYGALQRRRGTATLAALCHQYAHIPYFRTRSDAEARALERYAEAGKPLPQLNVKINGFEADLVDNGRIIEIDGPQFHLFPDEDQARDRAWNAAGYAVTRRPSDTVYR